MPKVSGSKKIIITGATGAIGQHLIPIFLKNGYEVQAITRDLKNAKKLNWFNDVDFIQLDINHTPNKLEINPEIGIIHLAWQGLPNYKAEFHISENLPSNYNFIKSVF